MNILITGLGNPGEQYERTRHNLGFLVLDELARSIDASWKHKRRLRADVAEGHVEGQKIILLKPMTYMNASGAAVAAAAKKFRVGTSDCWVVHDDTALDFGVLRVRLEGSSGGHNGVQSVIDHLGTDQFPRWRVGVGSAPERMKLEDWVLSRFSKDEQEQLPAMVERASKEITTAIKEGLENPATHRLA